MPDGAVGDRDNSLETALSWAEQVRAVRVQVVDEASRGSATLRDILDRAVTDPDVAVIKALVVLEVLPGSGKIIARRTMASLGLDEAVPFGGLDDAQRDQLVAAFS